MILITTIEHAYAAAISDAKKVATFVRGAVLPALISVQAEASTIEAVTSLVSPQLANLERVGDAVLGAAIKAIEDAGSATGGLSVALAAELVADVKAIIPLVKASANTAVVPTTKAA
jgi:hypothetical protein